MSKLKTANRYYREGKFSDALRLYEEIAVKNQESREMVDFNIKMAKKKGGHGLSKNLKSNGNSESSSNFSSDYYLRKYSDVRELKVNPRLHFDNQGWREGRKPNPVFDTKWYLFKNKDVRDADINPLLHFEKTGFSEKRDASPLFDTKYYLENNKDVHDKRINPLGHYLNRGCAEGRSPHPFFKPLHRDLGYHDEYYKMLSSIGAKLFPQKPLVPSEEKHIPRHIVINSKSNKGIIECIQKKTRNKIAVYSANVGTREEFAQWQNVNGVDFFCFTNKYHSSSEFVKVLDLDYYEYDPKRTALYYKTHARNYFSCYDYIIWCDQNVTIKNFFPLLHLVGRKDFKIASFFHWGRNCIYEEAKSIIKSKREKKEVVDSQIKKYKDEGFPHGFGLFETNILAMKSRDSEVDAVSKAWWSEIVSGASRDQLSFTYVLWKCSVKCLPIEPAPLNARNSSNYEYLYHD